MNDWWRESVEAALRSPENASALERLVRELLRHEGYEVETRGGVRDAGIDFVARWAQGGETTTYLGQVTCEKTWEKRKLPGWLKDLTRLHPEARHLMFVVASRVSGSKKEQLQRAEAAATGRELRILGSEWMLEILQRPECRGLAREYLGVPTRLVRTFLPAAEHAPHLATFRDGADARALPRFAGRRDELDRLAEALKRNDVVLIVGQGGVGKSRLAVEAASDEAVAAALPEAEWRFLHAPGALGDDDLAELPRSQPVVVVIDDPHRFPVRDALPRLRDLADHPDWPGRLKLVLTTRPENRDRVVELLGADARPAEVTLGPLGRRGMNDLLREEPIAIKSEPARSAIIDAAGGVPRIAEAFAALYRSRGGMPALEASDAIAALIDDVLAAAPRHLQPIVKDVFAVLSAFTALPWEHAGARDELAAALDIDRRSLEDVVDWILSTGWAEPFGDGIRVRPDTVGEIETSRRFFGSDHDVERFTRMIWKPFGESHGEAILERLAAARLAASAGSTGQEIGRRIERWVGDVLIELSERVESMSAVERLDVLRLASHAAPAAPDAVLVLAQRVARTPASPDSEEATPWGLGVGSVLDRCADTMQAVARRSLDPAVHARAMRALLELVERQDALEPSRRGLRHDRAWSMARQVVHPGWQTVGEDAAVAATTARTQAVIAWARDAPEHRGPRACELLALAASCRVLLQWDSPESEDSVKIAESRLADVPVVREHLSTVMNALVEVVGWDEVSRHAAIEALSSAWGECVPRSRASEETAGLAEIAQDAARRAFARLLAALDDTGGLSVVSRNESFEWLATIRQWHRHAGDDGEALLERLRGDDDLHLYRALSGGPSPFARDGSDSGTDAISDWRDLQADAGRTLVARAQQEPDGLRDVLETLARWTAEARRLGGDAPIHADLMLKPLTEEEPRLVDDLVLECATTHAEGLAGLAVSGLMVLWAANPRRGESAARRLLASEEPGARRLVARSLRGSLPDEAWALADELIADGSEELLASLADSLQWVGHEQSDAAASRLLDIGEKAPDSLLPETLGPLAPTAEARADPLQHVVPPARLNGLVGLLCRLVASGMNLPDRSTLSRSLDWLAAHEPAALVTAVRRAMATEPNGKRIAPLLPQVESALDELPADHPSRRELLRDVLKAVREGERLQLHGAMLPHLVSHGEAPSHCATARESPDDGDWRVFGVLAPKLAHEDFKRLLAKLVKATWPAEERRLWALLDDRILPKGRVYSGSLGDRYLDGARFLDEWRLSDSPELAEFAERAREALERRGRSWKEVLG